MEVILLAAITADGFIARSPDDRSFDWNSPEDKQFYVQTIRLADAVVMSSKSFKIIQKFPRGLTYAVYTRDLAAFTNHRPDVITAFPTNDSPADLLAKLKQQEKKRIVIAGGSSIYSLFLQSGLVTKMYLTVEPILFGQGVNLCREALDLKLKLDLVKSLSSQTLLLEYSLIK